MGTVKTDFDVNRAREFLKSLQVSSAGGILAYLEDAQGNRIPVDQVQDNWIATSYHHAFGTR
jgi:hypothetical protein